MIGAGSACLAGCSADSNGNRTDGNGDSGADEFETPSCGSGTMIQFDAIDAENLVEDVTVTEAEFSESAAIGLPPLPELLSRLSSGETETIEAVRNPPLEPSPYFRDGDEIYTVTTSVRDDGPISGPAYKVTRKWYTDVQGNDIQPFSALPRHDQWRLNEAIRSDTETLIAGSLDSDDRDESIFSSGERQLSIEFTEDSSHGRFFTATRDGDRSESAERIRYSASLVAADADSFAEYFLQEYGIRLTDLDDDVNALIEDAIANGGVELCTEGDDAEDETVLNALSDFVETLESETAAVMDDELRTRLNGYYVQYDGTWYFVQLSWWVV